jgi:type I restriction-modification system DNA methylase subunit
LRHYDIAMNEWEFTALAASWIKSAVSADPKLPFRDARCEQKGRGSNKRRDLTILGKDGSAVVTGEVKMPYRPEGSSPFRTGVVRDARRKAQRAKVDYFFTWNVNRCALWPTKVGPDDSPTAAYRAWDVIDIHRESQMQLEVNQARIQRWIPLFLRELADILRGDKIIERKPPDLRFIDALEAELEQPILRTTDALLERIRRVKPRNELYRWMREEQGWTIADSSDYQAVQADLNRAAQFANYALLNKVVFHEALLKRFGSQLERLDVPSHVDTAERLRLHLEGFFAKAREVTGDYETVFGDDTSSVGNRIPFYADSAVDFWRMLIGQIHEFDFSKLDYEIIGAIFERLISPEERHKYGQYYTRAEVVDLINAFCIRNGREKVMDPACGGGTFLVRAYMRKRELNAAQTHSDRLRDLFGVDISHFATHLTTINLATRDLIDDENYPQIARSDFFDVDPGSVILNVPRRMVTTGMGQAQKREVDIPMLDAIVGNPPYVRQEDIPRTPKKAKHPKRGTKEFYKHVAERGYGTDLSGRSDLHVYFWLHAAEFLHHGGRMGLLTSSQWLDVEYGFRLQEFILRHFEIEAVFESLDEPWFVGARVATAATILRRQPDAAARMNHLVRFVQLRRPMADVLEHDGTGAGAVAAANAFRDRMLALNEDAVTDQYRVRVVRQGDLWNRGVRLGKLMKKSGQGPSKDPDQQHGDYYGGKWGMYLRAPDVWFELIDRFGKRFTPLGDITEIRFGVKSGKDAFFFPIDATAEALHDFPDADTFQREFGVSRSDVERHRVKIVSCGDGRGELRPLEAELLEPLLHNLKDLDGFTLAPENCTKLILLTGRATENLPPYALAYIRWAETNEWDTGSSCSSRATETRAWHDLTGHARGPVLWSMRHGYRHIAPINGHTLQCNKSFFDVFPIKVDESVLAGLLNSTIAVLGKFIFGRPVGVEGYWATEVSDAKMMLVPDPRKATADDRRRVAEAFRAMKDRKALGFVSERRLRRLKYEQQGKIDELNQLDDRTELDMPDRWKLDDAVLRLIGVADKDERKKLLDKIYAHLRQHFEWTRQKEEQANRNKKLAKKKAPAGPAALAAEVIEQIKREHPNLMRSWQRHFLMDEPTFDTYELSIEGEPELIDDLIHANTLRFRKGRQTVCDVEARTPEQAALLIALAGAGVRGLVRVPHDGEKAAQLHRRFAEWWESRMATLRELVEQRTADEDLQDRTLGALQPLLPAA